MAAKDVEFDRERRDVHNFIEAFINPIVKLEPLFAKAAKAKEFLGSYDTVVTEKEEKLAVLDVQITEAQAHLDGVAPQAQEKRKAEEEKLEDDLVRRELNAIEPINARVTMAENSAKVLEDRIVGLDAQIVELDLEVQERHAVLADVNRKITDFYASLPERKVS